MLLVFPPVAKPSEPPAGIAQIAAALRQNGIPCELLDANLEGLLFLLGRRSAANDTWTRRAVKHAAANIETLRDPAAYRSPDRYSRAVRDLERLLSFAGKDAGSRVGLADHQHRQRSPVRSSDLLAAADHPDEDPFFPYFSVRLRERIGQGGFTTVGFSLNYLNQALTTFAMLGFLRRAFPQVRIVLGGGLVTSWMRRPGWRDPFGGLVDLVVAGPGEGPLLELLGAGGAARCSRGPDFSGLPLSRYLAPGRILPYSASNGCWWNKCSFCPEPAEGGAYAAVPPDQAVAHLKGLVQEHRPALLHLLDNAVSPALMTRMIDDPPGAPWYGFARIGQDLTDAGFCHALRRSGCVMLKLGLESGDQKVLDDLRKGIDLHAASQALANLKSAGIGTYVYLLFGTPAEDEAAARRTLEFAVRHADRIGFLNLAVFNMPAAAPEAAALGTRPFSDGDLSLYADFRHPAGWDRKKVRRFLDREFTRHPAVAEILRRDPPVFTSNHAAFVLMVK